MRIRKCGRVRRFTHQLRARITKEHLSMILLMAKKLHMNRSQVVRQAIVEYYKQIILEEIDEENETKGGDNI